MFILAIIAITLWYRYRAVSLQESNFLVDFKDAMKHAAIYVVLVSAFIWLYYSAIDSDFLEVRITDQLAAHKEYLSDPANLAELKKTNPMLEELSAEEILNMEEENKRKFLSPLVTATGSLVGLIFLSITYSLFATVLFRKVLLK
jgi:hypothetical protein